MKRRIIAGALVLLALLMTAACVNVPGYGLVSRQDAKHLEQQRQAEETARQQWREQEEQQRQEQVARQEAERQAREEQQRQQEVERQARQVRGNIRLYSAYAGTVLVNGEETQFTVEAGKDVNITIENAVGNEHTIAVRDSGGTVRQASDKVNITSNSTTYRASILDPNPPPNSGDDFIISQNAQGGITITGYTGTRRQVVIPQTIEGIRVTEIGQMAFYEKGLFSVTIPNSVTQIRDYAFGNNRLTGVIIPNSVTSIGNYAFDNNQLTSVTIGNSVTTIGNNAFRDNQLTSITIGNNVTSIGSGAFGGSITSITIPGNVRISSSSFPNGFSTFYDSQSKRAGTYTWSGRVWTVR